MQSDRQARERRPLVGTARRRRAAGKDPECGGDSPLGRNPGVQRHPDGCVVHAFRCASRSGAGPHRENWPEVGVPVPARHPFPVGYVPRPPSSRNWATRGFAALRAAVPAPTGRTGRRSAVPCQCVILSRWGKCRDVRHLGSGRNAVSLRCAQRCRPGGRRSRASASSSPAGVSAETSVIKDKQNEMARRKSRISRELLDEPLGGEDPPEAIRSGELLAELRQSLAE